MNLPAVVHVNDEHETGGIPKRWVEPMAASRSEALVQTAMDAKRVAAGRPANKPLEWIGRRHVDFHIDRFLAVTQVPRWTHQCQEVDCLHHALPLSKLNGQP